MKIAFPLKNESELAADFVHSRYIGIYDQMLDKTDLLPIEGVENSLGITMFFDVMTSQGLKSVISPYYSFMSLRVFKENNIETLKANGNDLSANIRQYINQQLQPYSVYDTKPSSPCSGSCTSCSTSCS